MESAAPGKEREVDGKKRLRKNRTERWRSA
jgi:hypothetical protein